MDRVPHIIAISTCYLKFNLNLIVDIYILLHLGNHCKAIILSMLIDVLHLPEWYMLPEQLSKALIYVIRREGLLTIL